MNAFKLKSEPIVGESSQVHLTTRERQNHSLHLVLDRPHVDVRLETITYAVRTGELNAAPTDLILCLQQGLALLTREEPGNLNSMRLDRLRKICSDRTSFGTGEALPRAVGTLYCRPWLSHHF